MHTHTYTPHTHTHTQTGTHARTQLAQTHTHTPTQTGTHARTHTHNTHTRTNMHTHRHVLLSSYIYSKLLLNMDISDGTNENFSQLVLESGTHSIPLPSIRLLSKSEYRGCVESFKIVTSLGLTLSLSVATSGWSCWAQAVPKGAAEARPPRGTPRHQGGRELGCGDWVFTPHLHQQRLPPTMEPGGRGSSRDGVAGLRGPGASWEGGPDGQHPHLADHAPPRAAAVPHHPLPGVRHPPPAASLRWVLLLLLRG